MATLQENSPGKARLSKTSVRIFVATMFTILIVGFAWPHFSTAGLSYLAKNANGWLAFWALVAFVFVNAIRTVRFRLVGARVPSLILFSITAVHAALLRVMPLRSGELIYGVLLKKKGGTAFTEAMAGLVMIRILDFATVLPLAAIVGFELLSPGRHVPFLAAIGVAGLFLVLTFFGLGPVLAKLRERLENKAHPASDQNAVMRGIVVFANTAALPIQTKMVLVGLTLVHWGVLIIWLNLCLMAVGVTSNVFDGFTPSVLGITGSILPISLVGSFGPMESGIALGIVRRGSGSEYAANSALLVSALTFACNWALGIFAWLHLISTKERGRVGERGVKEKKTTPIQWEPLMGAGFAIAGGLLLLFRIPYGFETNDQFQYLLLPYRSIYDGFLHGDWFTWHTTHYHVTFSYIIRSIHAAVGEDGFANAVFVLQLFVLTGIAYSIYRLTRSAGWNIGSAVIGLLIVSFIRRQGMGETVLNHGLLLPADMALVPLLLGCASWMEMRPLRAGLWLGVSGFLHANFALLGPLVIAPLTIYVWGRNRDVRQLLRLALGYLVIAWPALVVIVKSFLLTDSVPGAMELMFTVRSPHHYNPDLQKSTDSWWLIALMISGLPALLEKKNTSGARWFGAVMLVMLLYQVVAGIGTVVQVHSIVRLFLWRLSIPLMVLSSVAVGQSIVRALISREVSTLIFAVSSGILLGSFATKGFVRLGGEFELGGYGMLIPGMIPLVAAVLIPRFFPKRWAHIVAGGLCMTFLALAAFVTIPNSVLLQKQTVRWQLAADSWTRFEPVHIRSKALGGRNRDIYRWIRNHTPNDAAFLIPPGMDDFRMGARRGVFVDWKCCPMKGDEILKWKRRMLAAMGVDRFRVRGYALYGFANRLYVSRSLRDLADLARREGLTHILHTTRRDGTDAGLTRLTTRGRFSVYAVNSPSP